MRAAVALAVAHHAQPAGELALSQVVEQPVSAPRTGRPRPVVVFSFLRLTTHPKVRVLYSDLEHLPSVCQLLAAAGTAGNLVTDAQIAALALEYDAEVHSADTDYARFAGVRWINPLSAEAAR